MALDPQQVKAVLAMYYPLYQPFDCKDRLRKDPPLLAHYTSVQVAEQIIKNQEIWLSHPFYMNDIEELRLGMQAGIEQFPYYAQIAVMDQARTNILFQAFSHYVEHMAETTVTDTYILCLSEHRPGDTDGTLSMWRSYANQGHGAAIVFNARNISEPPQAPLAIGKVIYGTLKERITILNHGLNEWAITTLDAQLQDNQLHLAALGAFQFIKAFALMTKHVGFSEEAEWRIVYVPDLDPDGHLTGQLSYHISPRGVEPKLKFKIAPVQNGGAAGSLSLASLVEFILLGPSIASPIAKAAFCRALVGTCLEDLARQDRVFASTIPLRPTIG